MRRRGRIVLAAVLAMATLASGACSGGPTGGEAVTGGEVGGLPVTHFESGLKPAAPAPDVQVKNATDSEEDKLAIATIADLTDFWGERMPEYFDMKFRPLENLQSYDPRTDSEEHCGQSLSKAAMNAFFCQPEDLVAWDRAMLLPTLKQKYGPISIVTVLAHEYGHAVQFRLGPKAGVTPATKTIVTELQADCFTGAYLRYVAEDKSPYFRVSTSEGIGQALSTLYHVRDSAGRLQSHQGAHGTAFDRTFAFQVGFEQDPGACAKFDDATLKARTTQQKFDEDDIKTGKGDTSVNAENLKLVKESLDTAFTSAGGKPIEIAASGGACPSGPNTAPASYCPDTDSVTVDLAGLAQIGVPIDREAEFEGREAGGKGDFAAYASAASRYALGFQENRGLRLDDDNAGLRTACLVGSWAGFANRPRDVAAAGPVIRLSPGDVDESILELLQPKSLIASDVNGIPVPNIFARVEAFRNGYYDGTDVCMKNFA